jgi:hypothetical protein
MQAADLDPAQIKPKDTNAPIFLNAEIQVPAVDDKYWTDPAATAGAAKRIQGLPGLEEHQAV